MIESISNIDFIRGAKRESAFSLSQNEKDKSKFSQIEQKSKDKLEISDKSEKLLEYDRKDKFQNELTESEKSQVEKLKTTDRKVRAHEMAHVAAGGGLVRGGPFYQYEMGPDKRRYVVAGEVKIDSAPVPDDPQATIRKMQQVRRAALAPVDPSPQDRSVANQASRTESRARTELLKENMQELKKSFDDIDTNKTSGSKSNQLNEKYTEFIKEQSSGSYLDLINSQGTLKK